MAAFPKYSYLHMTGATGTIVKATEGTLAAVVLNKPIQGVITLKDGSNTIAVLSSGTGSVVGSVLYGGGGGIQFSNLVATLTSNSEDITLCFD